MPGASKIMRTAVGGLALAAATALWGQAGGQDWTPVSDERLRNPEPGDWALYRRTLDVNGYSPLTQIDKSNVAQLRTVWSFSMPDNSRWPATPIVANGLMYVASGTGRVVAFDAVSGDVVWTHERQYPKDIAVSQAFNRARGVAIHGDMIYWGTADAHLLALDARTGALVWDVRTGDYHTGDGHNHPPLVIDGKVFIGHSGGDRTVKGRFRAYDAKTGALLWTVYTAPRPGDPGYETWPKSDLPPLGVAPWNTISYDPELKLVYVGTGQPTPWSQAMRGQGRALYSNSILAVEADTGKIRWYRQIVPNDDWDRDSVYESMLLDLEIGGRTRKALVQTGKIGWGLVFDRVNGEFLGSFRTAYENVITGWTRRGEPIVDPKMIPTAADIGTDKLFVVCPHLHGARNLNAPSFSPITKLYYLGINNTCQNSKIVPVEFQEGQPMSGTGGEATMVPGYDYVGEFVAFDPVKGTRKWTYRPPGGVAMSASALATAGGIVFGGTVDRQFFALDGDTGGLLWQMRLNGDVSGAPISYAIDGRQYIAITAGGRPGPTTSFAGLTNTTLPQGSGMIWVLALPDSRDLKPYARASVKPVLHRSQAAELANAPPTPAAASGQQRRPGPGLYTVAQASRGRDAFQQHCSTCHKFDEQQALFESRWLTGSMVPFFRFISTTMPENKPGVLSKADYAAITAHYLSASGFPAGSRELPGEEEALERIPVSN